MSQEEQPKCDIGDMVCQMEVLAHLRGMQKALGEDRFKTDMPEFAGLTEQLEAKIATHEKTLEESMRSCGLLNEEGAEVVGEPIIEPAVIEEAPIE